MKQRVDPWKKSNLHLALQPKYHFTNAFDLNFNSSLTFFFSLGPLTLVIFILFIQLVLLCYFLNYSTPHNFSRSLINEINESFFNQIFVCITVIIRDWEVFHEMFLARLACYSLNVMHIYILNTACIYILRNDFMKQIIKIM